MAKKNYEERTEALLEPIVAAAGVSVYDVEYVKEGGEWYLRAYIDKPEGVNINDCETVSRALSDRLDEEDFIEDAYILEVSSPGLGRTLKKDKHLEKSIGQEVELKLNVIPGGGASSTNVDISMDLKTIAVSGPEQLLKQL